MTAELAVLLSALLLGCDATGRTLCDAPHCKCDSTTLQFGRVSCSCSGAQAQELILRSNDTLRIPGTTTSLLVSNCSRVTVQENALRGLQALRNIEISNIPELIVKSHGFDWNESTTVVEGILPRGIVIRIVNSSLSSVPSYSFRGRLDAVLLTNVQVRTVETFAFVSLSGMERLEMLDCVIEDIQSQAFKRFSIQYLVISGGRLVLLPSHAFMDLEVHREVLIKRVAINMIHSSAVRIRNSLTFRLIDSKVNHMAGESIRVSTRGPIIIQNNKFTALDAGALLGFSVDQQFRARYGIQELIFENNTITNFKNNSLVVDGNSFDPRFYRVYINHTCSCNALETWNFQLVTYNSNSLPQAGSQQPTEVLNSFWCLQQISSAEKPLYMRFQEYSNFHCGYTTRNIYVFIAIIVACLFAVLAIALLIIFIWRRRRANKQKEWINVPNGERDDGKKVTKDGKLVSDSRLKMVVPDGRTYRETELHVIVERAEPLREPN